MKTVAAVALLVAMVVAWNAWQMDRSPEDGDGMSEIAVLQDPAAREPGKPPTGASREPRTTSPSRPGLADQGAVALPPTVRKGTSSPSPSDGAAAITLFTLPADVALTAVLARRSGPDSSEGWNEIEFEAVQGAHAVRLTAGAWELAARSVDGAVSAARRIEVESGRADRVELDFRPVTMVRGLVYDGVFGTRLSSAQVRIVSSDGIGTSSEIGGASPGHTASTDPDGHFELRAVRFRSATLEIVLDGFSDKLHDIADPEDDGLVDAGSLTMSPVDRLEVRLEGIAEQDPTDYRIGEEGDSHPVAFDARAIAFIELPHATPERSLVLHSPDGVNLRIDLAGMPMDANPLVIDIGDRVEVRIAVEGWTEEDAARSLHACIASIGADGLPRVSAGEIVDGRATAHAWGTADVAVSLIEVDPEGYETLAATSLSLTHERVQSVKLPLAASAAWRILDEHGIPQPGTVAYATALDHPSRFNLALGADSEGLLRVPIGVRGSLAVNLHLPDGTLATDLELAVPNAPGEVVDIRVDRAESYEVSLSDAGTPVAWHRVSICSSVPTLLDLFVMTDAHGALRPFDFRIGSRPRVVIHDPRLFEYGRSFPLGPGRNEIEVRRTGTLSVELASEAAAGALVLGGAEVAGWLAEGKVRRDVARVGEGVEVRYSPLPLGTYPCTVGGVERGPIVLERAGATTTVRL